MNVNKIIMTSENNNSSDSTTPPLNPELINEFLGNSTGITNSLLTSLINSDHDNPLRQNLINQFNNELYRKVKSKQYASKLVITEQLTADQQNKLQLAYDDVELVFTNSVVNAHAFAAASRKCERNVLLTKIGVDVKVDKARVVIRDIGGNIVSSVLAGERGIHACSPILSPYDATRATNRYYTALTQLRSGFVKTEYEREVLKLFVASFSDRKPGKYFCFNRGQECNVKADALLFLHSNYDITLDVFGDIMDRAEAYVAYGSFVYDSRILTDDAGLIPFIDSQFLIERDFAGKRSKIRFGFRNCNGFNYEHKYDTYISYLTRSQFRSNSGNYYSLELLENRCGVQFFRVTRMFQFVGVATTHRLYLTHLHDKYLIRYPKVSYFFHGSSVRYPKSGNMVSKKLDIDSSFWRGLPRNTEWIYYEVDADVVDRTCAYVLGATEDKFKPEQIVTYIRSITTREVMYSSVVARRELPKLDDLSALTYAIYLTLYQAKYIYGKTLQQAIVNINATRSKAQPKNLLLEFQPEKKGFVRRLLSCLGPRNHNEFDVRQLIITPSEFIEYTTPSGGPVVINNLSSLPEVEFRDPIITGNIVGDIPAPDLLVTPEVVTKPLERKFSKRIKGVYSTIADNCNYLLSKMHVPNSTVKPVDVVVNNPPPKPSRKKYRAPPIPSVLRSHGILNSEVELPVPPPRKKKLSRSISKISSCSEGQPIYAELDFKKKNEDNQLKVSDDGVEVGVVDSGMVVLPEKTQVPEQTIEDDHMTKVFANYFSIGKKSDAPSFSCKHGMNRSYAKLLECLVLVNSDLLKGKILDVCGAPGGFVSLFLDLGVPASALTTFSLPDIPYASRILSSGVSITYGDIKEVAEKLRACSQRYGLVVADGAIETSYKDFSLFDIELELAFEMLTEGGSLVIKHNNYYSDHFRKSINKLTNRFKTIYVMKPYHSLITNSEIYVIANIFGSNIEDSEVIWTETIERLQEQTEQIRRKMSCNHGFTMKQLRQHVSNDIEYPRPGLYDPQTKLISVDGSRGECCFLAAAEDRKFDVADLKVKLRRDHNDTITPDLASELFPGAIGGSAFLEAFAKSYHVQFIVNNNYGVVYIPSEADGTEVRTITLHLINGHYYIYNKCSLKSEPVVQRRDELYEPLDKVAYTTGLVKLLNVKVFDRFNVGDIKRSGVYYFNNLRNYCSIHDVCSNNGLNKTIDQLYRVTDYTISIVHTVEAVNYSIPNLEKVVKGFKDLAIRYLDYPVHGYLTLIIYRTANVPKVSPVVAYSAFVAHKCSGGNKLRLDVANNIILTCARDNGPVVVENSPADLNVIIRRCETVDNVVEHSSNWRLVLNGIGEGTKADNMPVIANAISGYIGKLDPGRYLSVHLESDFSNVSIIMNLLKNRATFFSVIVKGNSQAVPDTSFSFLPDVSTLDKRKNSMTEAYSMWYYERRVVEDTLRSGYHTVVSALANGDKVCSKTDNSLIVLDLFSGNYVYGTIFKPPYSWGFDGSKLINTETLFDREGKLVPAEIKVMRDMGLKYICFNSASRMIHGITLTDSYSVAAVNYLKDIPITFVQGVPGGGKTSYILNKNLRTTKNLILTVTREARDDIFNRAREMKLTIPSDNIRTIDSFLVNFSGYSGIEEVWIDEALLVHCGLWNWVAMLSACKRLVVVGDSAQIPYINRSGMEVHYNNPADWVTERENLTVNYRNPLDIVYWLHSEKFYGFKVKGTSTKLMSTKVLKISGISEIPNKSDWKYLTFTQAEKATMVTQGYNTSTIHEYQGNQADNIALVRLNIKEADKLFESKPHILVALTRHRKEFVYYSVIEDTTFKVVNKISTYSKTNVLSVKLDLHGGGYYTSVTPDSSVIMYQQDRALRNLLIDNYGSGYVPYFFRKNYLFHEEKLPRNLIFDCDSVNVFQEYFDRIYGSAAGEFREVDHDDFEYHALSYHPFGVETSLAMPSFKSYDRLAPRLKTSIQYPLHKSQKVSLKAFFERNGQVPQLQGLINDATEARRMVDLFMKLCPRKGDFKNKLIRPNIVSLDDWMNGQAPAVRKMVVNEESFLDQDLTVYDFIIKVIPKIDLDYGAEFRYKSPQTIAYQPKIVNSVFCPILKEFMNRIEFALHDDILLYNGMSPNEFAQLFSQRFPIKRYREMWKFLEIDFSKYDKSQGLVILLFEAMLMEEFGVDAFLIKLWIVMHRYTRIRDRSGKISAFVEYQRKSGDAGTWRLNTVVQIAIINRVLRLYTLIYSGKIVACFSGDDSLIFTALDIYDLPFKMYQLQFIYNLEAKLMNYKVPYFCSKFLIIQDSHWIFVPDTVKLVVKLGRADMVDYEHVEAYRVSFDDNLYYYKFENNWNAISMAINDRYKLVGEHDLLFMALNNIVANRESFSMLYFMPKGFRLGKISTRPTIDI